MTSWTYTDDGAFEYDDEARVVKNHTTGHTRPYNEQENAAANDRFLHEVTLGNLEERIRRIEEHLWPPVQVDPETPPPPTEEVPTFEELGGIWPNGALLTEGGKVWHNVSGVPLTAPPSAFPGEPTQWTHLFVEVAGGGGTDPEPGHPEGYVGEWDAEATYKVGDVVQHAGRYYRCKVAHGPEYQGTWAPPQASVWDDLGAV